jgi:N-acetylglucosaminyl-diphospho-decaprenol L-rhamnosyltransferase
MLTIITVTYNSRIEIERFVLSLSDMLRRYSIDAETRIWDNASSDGTAQYLLSAQKTLPDLRMRLELSSKNVGLSKAVNSEIASSGGEWVLLCNPDVEFSGEVPTLLKYASSHPEYGVVPDLKNPDGTTQRSIHRRFPSFTRICFEYTSLGRYSSLLLPFVRNDYKYSHTEFSSPGVIEQPGGTFLLLHRKTLDRLSKDGQLYNERFPVFWNDVDLSMRARVEGVKFVILPEVRILHGFGHSVKSLNREMLLMLFFGQHGLVGFAERWRMHPRAIQAVLFFDSIFVVALGFAARIARRGPRHGTSGVVGRPANLRWRVMKFWCSLH